MHARDEVVDGARLDDDPPVPELVAHVAHRRLAGARRAGGRSRSSGPGRSRRGRRAGPRSAVAGRHGAPGPGHRVSPAAARARPASRRRVWPAGGLKHTPARPVGTRPAVTCKVMAAEGKENSASRLARTGLVRAQQGVEQAHQCAAAGECRTPSLDAGPHPGWFISASSLASWSRRFWSGGWVEKSVDRLVPWARAGVK